MDRSSVEDAIFVSPHVPATFSWSASVLTITLEDTRRGRVYTINIDDTARDAAWRRAAQAYFAQKSARAEACFDSRALRVFTSFKEHWLDFFAPEDAESGREYAAMSLEQRERQFERFRREFGLMTVALDATIF